MLDSRSGRRPLSGTRDDGQYRRALRAGLVVSLLLHVALFLTWRGGAPLPEGTGSQEARAAGAPVAGDALRAVDVAPRPSEPIPPPPEPVERPEERQVVREVPVAVEFASVELTPRDFRRPSRGDGRAAAASDSRSGAREGAVEPGSGTPPTPRSLLPEWDPPSEVRGTEVTVRVHVDARGEPTGPVELRPSTPHEGFNEKLVAKVREMRFAPARSPEGDRVDGWAELTFVF